MSPVWRTSAGAASVHGSIVCSAYRRRRFASLLKPMCVSLIWTNSGADRAAIYRSAAAGPGRWARPRRAQGEERAGAAKGRAFECIATRCRAESVGTVVSVNSTGRLRAHGPYSRISRAPSSCSSRTSACNSFQPASETAQYCRSPTCQKTMW